MLDDGSCCGEGEKNREGDKRTGLEWGVLEVDGVAVSSASRLCFRSVDQGEVSSWRVSNLV
jgi:hypothetical protein